MRDPDIEREIWLDMKMERERKKQQEIQIWIEKSFEEQCKKNNISFKEANQ